MLPISYVNRATNNQLRKLILHRRIKIAKLCSKLISSVPNESELLSNTHIALHKRWQTLKIIVSIFTTQIAFYNEKENI